jgi:hypothetical protein
LLVHIPTGNFGFRLVNVSPSVALIDAYVTAPGADLAAASPVVSGLAYNVFSNFVSTPVGSYQLRITRADTKQVIYDAALPAAPDGGGQTVVAYTVGSGNLVNVALFTDGVAATLLPNTLAQLKAVNASSVGSALNLFVDGSLTLANLPYTGASNYQAVATGTRTITVEASATPGYGLTDLADAAPTDTSIALYGARALNALVLTDPTCRRAERDGEGPHRQRPAGGRCRRCSQTPAAGPGRAKLGAPDTRSSRQGGVTTYQFDFDSTGTTTPVVTLPESRFREQRLYETHHGSPGAVQAILVQDF